MTSSGCSDNSEISLHKNKEIKHEVTKWENLYDMQLKDRKLRPLF